MDVIRLHLTGGDGFGWALDEDIETFRSALPPQVQLVALKEAEFVYSPWWRGVMNLGAASLVGKRVICGFDNPVFHWITRPDFRMARDIVGFWLAHSSEALRQAHSIGLNCGLVPYTLRTEIFQPPSASDFSRKALRRKLGLPPDAYIIGNFQRDSEGLDLTTPKLQKGPDLFAEIVRELHDAGCPIHILLAGPRRHWLRNKLASYRLPFTYVGKDISSDDIKTNLLKRPALNELYHALDLYLLTSRWEGGPYALLEAAGTRTKIVSSSVGIAQDMLEPMSIFADLADAVARIKGDIVGNLLAKTVETQYQAVLTRHTSDAAKPLIAQLVQQFTSIPVFERAALQTGQSIPERPGNSFRERLRRRLHRIIPRQGADSGLTVSIFREYVKPPYGGGNQFMIALRAALLARGVRVLNNQVGEAIDGYIFDSLWFEQKLLDKLARLNRPRVVHRIDGPIHLYRGKDKALDDRIFEINKAFATTSVIQSTFTLRELYGAGYKPVNPVVIRNASDPTIFNREGKAPFELGRKVRLISSAWSSNPRKGGDVYAWLDQNLDWNKYDYTFLGRSSVEFSNIRRTEPVPSKALAAQLKACDIYITASQNDPCSNALVEALSCGLPAIYLKSGGHPELVGTGGLGFDNAQEIPALLDRMVHHYQSFQSCIRAASIFEVVDDYLVCATTG